MCRPAETQVNTREWSVLEVSTGIRSDATHEGAKSTAIRELHTFAAHLSYSQSALCSRASMATLEQRNENAKLRALI